MKSGANSTEADRSRDRIVTVTGSPAAISAARQGGSVQRHPPASSRIVPSLAYSR